MTTSQATRDPVPDTVTPVGEWCGAAEIAALFGVSRQRVQQLVTREDFPEPEIILAMGKIWSLAKVTEWAERHGRTIR